MAFSALRQSQNVFGGIDPNLFRSLRDRGFTHRAIRQVAAFPTKGFRYLVLTRDLSICRRTNNPLPMAAEAKCPVFVLEVRP